MIMKQQAAHELISCSRLKLAQTRKIAASQRR
jgi:hypothetical protein